MLPEFLSPSGENQHNWRHHEEIFEECQNTNSFQKSPNHSLPHASVDLFLQWR